MTRKIKHVSELPEWFQLEKYTAAKNLTAEEWYQQIAIRYSAFENRNYRSYVYLNEESDKNNISSYYENLLRAIHCKPIIDVNADDFWKEYEGVLSPDTGIRSVSLMDYAMIAKTISSEKLNAVKKVWDKTFDENNNVETPSYGKDPVYKFGDGDIRFDEYWDVAWIDLAISDDLLVENFKSYLKIRRKGMQETIENKDAFKRFNFENWNRLGLLPYIDLFIWSKVENISIPYRVMADAIFPLGERGEETIRKTTKPLAQVVLTDISRSRLASLAIAEKAEKISQ